MKAEDEGAREGGQEHRYARCPCDFPGHSPNAVGTRYKGGQGTVSKRLAPGTKAVTARQNGGWRAVSKRLGHGIKAVGGANEVGARYDTCRGQEQTPLCPYPHPPPPVTLWQVTLSTPVRASATTYLCLTTNYGAPNEAYLAAATFSIAALPTYAYSNARAGFTLYITLTSNIASAVTYIRVTSGTDCTQGTRPFPR